MKFNHFPELKTGRLILRKIEALLYAGAKEAYKVAVAKGARIL